MTDPARDIEPIQEDAEVKPFSLQWRHNERDGVWNHQPHDCLLTLYSRRRSKKTSKLRVTGFCKGNSPVTGKFPAQRASNAENFSIWWRHHVEQYPLAPEIWYSYNSIITPKRRYFAIIMA